MAKFHRCEDFQLLKYLCNFVSVKFGSNSTLKGFLLLMCIYTIKTKLKTVLHYWKSHLFPPSVAEYYCAFFVPITPMTNSNSLNLSRKLQDKSQM